MEMLNSNDDKLLTDHQWMIKVVISYRLLEVRAQDPGFGNVGGVFHITFGTWSA